MNRIIIFIIAVFMLAGCQKNKVPEYVIPPEDMTSILVDIHLTDGMLSSSEIRRDFAKRDSANIYNILLHNYGYNRKDFDTSLFYYSKNLTLYDKIYNDVLNQLNEMETQLKEENQDEQSTDKE
ncbi:MAG: hypothetical protein PWP52_2249 [Bacteroidales bacterium]|jgi:hypothetical protein|nr:hypothetical protein [Bacteroidales bacterium]